MLGCVTCCGVVHRRGVYKVNVRGSDFANPILLKALPETGALDIGVRTGWEGGGQEPSHW